MNILYIFIYLFQFNAVGFVPKSDIGGKLQESSCELRQHFDTVACGLTIQIFHPVPFYGPRISATPRGSAQCEWNAMSKSAFQMIDRCVNVGSVRFSRDACRLSAVFDGVPAG